VHVDPISHDYNRCLLHAMLVNARLFDKFFFTVNNCSVIYD